MIRPTEFNPNPVTLTLQPLAPALARAIPFAFALLFVPVRMTKHCSST